MEVLAEQLGFLWLSRKTKSRLNLYCHKVKFKSALRKKLF